MVKLNKQDITEALKGLMTKGFVWALCPVCKIPLSEEEYKNFSCGSCGKLHPDDIMYTQKKGTVC